MGSKRSTTPRQQVPASSARRTIYTNDTSATMPAGKKNITTSTTFTVDDFSFKEPYELQDDLEVESKSGKSSGFAAWQWLIEHWQIPTSILSLSALILVFATRLDSKVDVLSGDVKDMKNTMEKLSTDSTRTNTEVGQIQRIVNRLEEQRLRK